MKKSEMARQMAEYWVGLFPGENPENMGVDEELVEDIAGKMESLLGFLEHRGMKPPVEKVCPVLFTSTQVWEDEDA
jgi:hypothetical protein